MPHSIEELADILENGDGGQRRTYGRYSADFGRLIAFAPKDSGWEWLLTVDHTWWFPIKRDGQFEELKLETLFKYLSL